MMKYFLFFLFSFFCLTVSAQSVTDDYTEFNLTHSIVGFGSTHQGIGMAVHDFDQVIWNTRLNYENFLLSDAVAMLIDEKNDLTTWSYPVLTHGLLGDTDLRLNVYDLKGVVLSVGPSLTHYHISGAGIINGQYYCVGASIGADMILDNETGIFTNAKFNFPFSGKKPNLGDQTDLPMFTQVQVIAKYSMFSLDYDLILVDGYNRSNLRFGFWFDF